MIRLQDCYVGPNGTINKNYCIQNANIFSTYGIYSTAVDGQAMCTSAYRFFRYDAATLAEKVSSIKKPNQTLAEKVFGRDISSLDQDYISKAVVEYSISAYRCTLNGIMIHPEKCLMIIFSRIKES